MLLNARRRRIASVLALVAALGVVSACGQNLGKSNFARTTVAAEAGSGGEVPTGDINDPAVAPAVMRTIDPCPLVGKEALSSLGTPEDPRPSLTSFGTCMTKVVDAGGKKVTISVDIGASTYLNDSGGATVSVVEGLPQVERKSKDGKSCDVGVMTLRKPERGMSFAITYDGGDPCATGRAVAAKAVKSLHSSPAKFQAGTGTLTAVDPCTVADPAVLAEVVPHGATSPSSFHACDWTPGSNPRITIGFRHGIAPEAREGSKKVDIDGVSTYQKGGSGSNAECKIEWQHKPWIDDDGVEIVGVSYQNYDEKKDEAASCEKAAKIAKSVISKLPKP
ncbi:DUF3558 domain-containing protein [Amycolatopsis alba]|uniref:DUF3558 domain-containing protein n=1 Tax=Amycolatopsis alba TaxID=76020 RepID=UPI001FD7E52B|nr:DUF3558 domain-containing protein [Amycolatopsis alba]